MLGYAHIPGFVHGFCLDPILEKNLPGFCHWGSCWSRVCFIMFRILKWQDRARDITGGLRHVSLAWGWLNLWFFAQHEWQRMVGSSLPHLLHFSKEEKGAESDRMLKFIQCFCCLHWNDHMNSVLIFVMCWVMRVGLCCELGQSHIPTISSTWLWNQCFYTGMLNCWCFVKDFSCFYTHQGSCSVVWRFLQILLPFEIRMMFAP